MPARKKIRSLDDAARWCRRRQNSGDRLVFTNGCFDLLHVGHLRYLEQARQWGDFLVVGVNSDGSVRRIKGARRPLVSEEDRAELVAGLHCVDGVVIFDEPDPYRLIDLLRPDVLVKGADWPLEQIVGADLVTGRGGVVRRIPVVQDRSTSQLIRRIIEAYGEKVTDR